jgi:hypothetical protein
MKRARMICLVAAATVLSACGGVDTCEEPEFYESAVIGKRIEAPENLDGLAAGKELVIPEASPRAPRPQGSGCLDRPPTLNLEEKES